MEQHLHPLLIVLAIVVGVSLLGLILSYIISSTLMRGYGEIAPDVEVIARKLRAEKFRDGDDLVLSGNYGKYPAIVRFSYADNTPGLNVRMKAPSNFTLSVSPKASQSGEGRALIRTGDDLFDARFATRTDHPTQARLFLSGRQASSQLQKLCCSSKTFLTFASGSLELSELVIPQPYTGKHVSDHLDSMGQLAAALAAMPGADAVKITPYKRERNLVARTAMVVLAIVGIFVVVAELRERSQQQITVAAAPADSGIMMTDRPLIPGSGFWRVAKQDDYDPTAVGWLQGQHSGKISGMLTGDYSGDSKNEDAYVLVGVRGAQTGLRRVVVLSNKKVLFDGGFNSVAIAAVVPHDNFPSIKWQKGGALPADGDALLVVKDANDPTSGLVIYSSGGKPVSSSPTNYQQVAVE